jgi:hypothetical protein
MLNGVTASGATKFVAPGGVVLAAYSGIVLSKNQAFSGKKWRYEADFLGLISPHLPRIDPKRGRPWSIGVQWQASILPSLFDGEDESDGRFVKHSLTVGTVRFFRIEIKCRHIIAFAFSAALF